MYYIHFFCQQTVKNVASWWLAVHKSLACVYKLQRKVKLANLRIT